eukprot:419920-Amphidinium_carterae.2
MSRGWTTDASRSAMAPPQAKSQVQQVTWEDPPEACMEETWPESQQEAEGDDSGPFPVWMTVHVASAVGWEL